MAQRDPFEARKVVGRRGKAVKKPLSRDVIVDAALESLKRRGPEGLSLRRVAAALDTGPASLYVYVADLGEFEALVLDRALAQVRTGLVRGGPWAKRLRAVLGSYFRVLSDTPALGQLAMRTIAAGPNAMRLLEALLEILADAGIDEANAAWAVDLLLLYVTAIAVEQGQRRAQPDPVGTVAGVIGVVSEAEHPRVFRARKALVSGGGEARFDWALQVLLNGILRTPPKTGRRGKSNQKVKS